MKAPALVRVNLKLEHGLGREPRGLERRADRRAGRVVQRAFEPTRLRRNWSCSQSDDEQRERPRPHRFTQIRITPQRFVNSAGAPLIVGYASMPAMSEGGIVLISWNCM